MRTKMYSHCIVAYASHWANICTQNIWAAYGTPNANKCASIQPCL